MQCVIYVYYSNDRINNYYYVHTCVFVQICFTVRNIFVSLFPYQHLKAITSEQEITCGDQH